MNNVESEELFKYVSIPLLPMTLFSIYISFFRNLSEFLALSFAYKFLLVVLFAFSLAIGCWGYFKWGFFSTLKKITITTLIMILFIVLSSKVRDANLSKRQMLENVVK